MNEAGSIFLVCLFAFIAFMGGVFVAVEAARVAIASGVCSEYGYNNHTIAEKEEGYLGMIVTCYSEDDAMTGSIIDFIGGETK